MTYLALRWTGDSFTPLDERAQKAMDAEYVVGEIYRFERHEARSITSHNHYFAIVHGAWATLPEHLAGDFPSPEHLRKFALIKAGYGYQRKVVCSTAAEAIKTAGLLQELDEFSIVEVAEKVVTLHRAKSQSMKAMGKRDFQESKDAVLQVISQIVGSDVLEAA
jgi:hypothetical protein